MSRLASLTMAVFMTATIDNGNLYTWTRIDYWRDALGRSDVETGFLDDGRTYNSDLDNGDAFIWSRIDNWADSLARLDYQNGFYDADDATRPGLVLAGRLRSGQPVQLGPRRTLLERGRRAPVRDVFLIPRGCWWACMDGALVASEFCCLGELHGCKSCIRPVVQRYWLLALMVSADRSQSTERGHSPLAHHRGFLSSARLLKAVFQQNLSHHSIITPATRSAAVIQPLPIPHVPSPSPSPSHVPEQHERCSQR